MLCVYASPDAVRTPPPFPQVSLCVQSSISDSEVSFELKVRSPASLVARRRVLMLQLDLQYLLFGAVGALCLNCQFPLQTCNLVQ